MPTDKPIDAGAPEIEITPDMIRAGLEYLDETALRSLTTQVAYPEFVIEFYRLVVSAKKR
jgi:hypothetical protein